MALDRSLTVACLAASLTACNPAGDSAPAIDRDAIAIEIKADVAETVEAFNARDPDRATRSNAPDFVQMVHGQPNANATTNLANVKMQVADPALKLTIADEQVEVAEAGDMAFYTTQYAYTFTDPASGRPATEIGNWVIVYRRQPDGSMKIFREIISDLPGEG